MKNILPKRSLKPTVLGNVMEQFVKLLRQTRTALKKNMKLINICTVVTGKTLDEFLDNLEKIQKLSDFVELRIDYIKNVSLKDIEIIKRKTNKKTIFTCRSKNEGGLFEGNEQERKAIIEKAGKLGFDYIDIELSAVKQFTSLINSNQTKIILSFHDFEKTPSLEELEKIKNQMGKYKNSIMKFATVVQNDEDIKTLYKLLLNKQKDEEMIVIGMGEKGIITRILGPLLGSYLTFASTPYSQSAPGQIDVNEMKKIYNSILSLRGAGSDVAIPLGIQKRTGLLRQSAD